MLFCQHADEPPAGCGTSEFCVTCGANRAVEACENQRNGHVEECRIIQKDSGRALDLRVATHPIRLAGQTFTLLSLTDISHEKRRQALERVFFHDLLNIAGSIMGNAELLQLSPEEEHDRIAESLKGLVSELSEEIRGHEDLAAAERDDLILHFEPLRSRRVLEDAARVYRNHECGRGRRIVIEDPVADATFTSDRRLVMRVLGNILKNACEAVAAGDTVTLGCSNHNESVEFRVHNPGSMPREVQLQVFQRSFSTKGAGRGLGTYSIKLLTENYLNGRVWFTSSDEAGTAFHVSYPLLPPQGEKPA
jgi:signal transduction histidine kinase